MCFCFFLCCTQLASRRRHDERHLWLFQSHYSASVAHMHLYLPARAQASDFWWWKGENIRTSSRDVVTCGSYSHFLLSVVDTRARTTNSAERRITWILLEAESDRRTIESVHWSLLCHYGHSCIVFQVGRGVLGNVRVAAYMYVYMWGDARRKKFYLSLANSSSSIASSTFSLVVCFLQVRNQKD